MRLSRFAWIALVTITQTIAYASDWEHRSLSGKVPPDALTIIGEQEIRLNPGLDVADLLKLHTGMEINRLGGLGQMTSLYVRGLPAQHTVVMLDGVIIDSGNSHRPALHNIKTELIERIEVVKGSAAATLAPGAIGGVINLISRRPDGDSGHRIGLTLGNHNTTKPDAGLHTTRGTARANIHMMGDYADGTPSLENSDFDRGHYNNSGVASYEDSYRGWLLDLSAWHAKGNTQYQTLATSSPALMPIDQDFENDSIRIDLSKRISTRWSTGLRLSEIYDHHHQHQNKPYNFSTTRRDTLDWHNDLTEGAHRLLFGLEASREHVSGIFNPGDVQNDEHTSAISLWATDVLDLEPGVLYVGMLARSHSDADSGVAWNVAYTGELGARSRYHAAFGSAFRQPNAIELFGPVGNLNSDNEHGTAVELGITQDLAAEGTVAFVVFSERAKDLLSGAPSLIDSTNDLFNGMPVVYTNSASIETRGLNASYRVTHDQWGARVDATWLSAIDGDTRMDLPYRARQLLSAGAYWRHHRDTYSADCLLSGERPITAGGTAMLGGYGLLQIATERRLSDNWELRGKIANLLDKRYTLTDGYIAPERSVYIEILYQTGA